jgi:transposase
MDYNIPEEAFQKIYDFLVTIPGIHTKNESKIRIFLEAMFYLCRTGCPIRLLPREYGNCFFHLPKISKVERTKDLESSVRIFSRN